MSEANFNLTGDQARLLMTALATSEANMPAKESIIMYLRLASISEVQPPQKQENE